MLLLGLVLEGGLGGDSLDQGVLIRGGGAEEVLQNILPGTGLLEGGVLSIREEANVNKDLNELGEASVTESATGFKLDFSCYLEMGHVDRYRTIV